MAKGLQDYQTGESVAPAVKALTYADSATAVQSRAVYIGVDADYTFTINGVAVVFKGCIAGTILPISATVVTGQGSTGDIIFLY